MRREATAWVEVEVAAPELADNLTELGTTNALVAWAIQAAATIHNRSMFLRGDFLARRDRHAVAV